MHWSISLIKTLNRLQWIINPSCDPNYDKILRRFEIWMCVNYVAWNKFLLYFCTKHILRCKCENAVQPSDSPFYGKPCSVWHGPLVSTRCAWSKVPVAKMATRGQQLDVSANNCLTSLLMTAFSGLNEQPNWSGVATVRPTGRLIEASDVRGDECRTNGVTGSWRAFLDSQCSRGRHGTKPMDDTRQSLTDLQ